MRCPVRALTRAVAIRTRPAPAALEQSGSSGGGLQTRPAAWTPKKRCCPGRHWRRRRERHQHGGAGGCATSTLRVLERLAIFADPRVLPVRRVPTRSRPCVSRHAAPWGHAKSSLAVGGVTPAVASASAPPRTHRGRDSWRPFERRWDLLGCADFEETNQQRSTNAFARKEAASPRAVAVWKRASAAQIIRTLGSRAGGGACWTSPPCDEAPR